MTATAAMTAMVALAPAAHAATNVVVGGSSAPGDHQFFGATNGSPGILRAGGLTINCSDVYAEGNIHAGAPAAFATIEPVPFGGSPSVNGMQWDCAGTLDFAIEPLAPWQMNADGPATSATTDLVTGYASRQNGGPIQARVYAKGASAVCDFIISGYADSWFDEATQTLAFDETTLSGNLIVSTLGGGGMSNCFGLVSINDPVGLDVQLVVGPSQLSNDLSGVSVLFPAYLS